LETNSHIRQKQGGIRS